jgi:multiple sugar transport system permease protein
MATAVGTGTGTRSGQGRKKRWLSISRREALFCYLFISPWVLGFVIFTAGPILASLYFSFNDYAIIAPAEWVGLKNFNKLFTGDDLFWKSLWNTFYYVALGVPLRIVFAFALATLLNQQIRGRLFYRVAYYMPSIIPGVASAVLWIILLNPRLGLINLVLSLFGIDGPNWLGSPDWSKPAMILMSLWGVGGSMVLYLAGLQGIPESLYEAADIDGASRWLKFWNVTIPLMTPTILYNLILQIIGSFQVFGTAFIMTRGGPLNSTLFYMIHLYDYAFQFFKMGYASALAWVLFVIIMFFTLITLKWSQIWVFYAGEKQ